MHIVHAVEHKEWPVSTNFTAGDEADYLHSNEKDNSEIITITTDHGLSRALNAANASISAAKKRKRHIAIDVETERGKLN